jgi:5'(3')-deoxyribonucleotidase
MRRIFIDCDGVLADFDRAYADLMGGSMKETEEKLGWEEAWAKLREKAPNFYAELPVMPDAWDLMRGLQKYRPVILTGCPEGGWSEAQKIAWGQEHFKGFTMCTVGRSFLKNKYCHAGDILVDDYLKYAKDWIEANGLFVLHINAKNSLAIVQSIMEKPHA